MSALGDSRIENIEAMRLVQMPATMVLIRSPMLSQVKRVIRHVDVSFNTEIEVIRKLSLEAQKADRIHSIVIMIELGDLSEGIMSDDLTDIVRETLSLPNILFKGTGTNLACRSGVPPDSNNMAMLSELADSLDATFGLTVVIVSGGNSANLEWAWSGAEIGRINDLRLGEAILLGCETLQRQPIDGLHTDAITLSAEVIEAKVKPSQPSGTIAQTAFGEAPPVTDRGLVTQAILAIGQQDIDPDGLNGGPLVLDTPVLHAVAFDAFLLFGRLVKSNRQERDAVNNPATPPSVSCTCWSKLQKREKNNDQYPAIHRAEPSQQPAPSCVGRALACNLRKLPFKLQRMRYRRGHQSHS